MFCILLRLQYRSKQPGVYFGRTKLGVLAGESLEIKEAHEGRKAAQAEMMRVAAGMPDLLAMRRAAFEEKLRSGSIR